LKPIRACCVVKSAFFLVAPPRGGFAMAPRDSGMCWKQFMMCLEEVWFDRHPLNGTFRGRAVEARPAFLLLSLALNSTLSSL